MAFKDTVVELTLRAKNLISGATDAAKNSVEGFGTSAAGLKSTLRDLEDQGALVKEFKASSKAVERTGTAYKRLEARAEKMALKLEKSSDVTEQQTREWYDLQDAIGVAGAEYKKAEKTLGNMASEAEAAGVDLSDLEKTQSDLTKETKATRRAMADFVEEVDDAEKSSKLFRESLSSGVTTFIKWGAAVTAAGTALAAVAFSRFATTQADLARQTLASASAFGISAVELQKWQFANQTVGIGAEKTADIMKDVAEKIGDAYLTGGGEAREVVQGLGLDLAKLAAMSPDEQILAVAAALEGMPKPGQIQILEALASDASLLLPLLDNNAAKLRELGNLAEERGKIFTQEELEELAEANAAFKRITTTVQGFANDILVKLTPAFKSMAEAIDEALSDKPELVEKVSKALDTVLGATIKWVTYLTKNNDKIGDSFGSVTSTVNGLRLTIVALFRGVQSFGAGAAEVAARFAFTWKEAGLAILEVRNSIGLATDEAVESARFALENTGRSVLELKKQSEDFQKQMVEAGNAAASAFNRAKDSAIDTSVAVGKAAASALGWKTATEGASQAVDESTKKTATFAESQKKLKDEIEQVATALETAGAALASNDTEAGRKAVAGLNKEYASLLATLKELQAAESVKGVNGADAVQTNPTAERYREATKAVNETGEAAEKTYSQVVTLGEGVEQSGAAVQDVGEKATSSAGSVGAAIGAIFNGWSNHISSLSARAGAAFTEALGGQATEATSALEGSLGAVNNRLADMRKRLTNGSSISGILRDWAKAGFDTERSFLQQAVAVENLTDRILEGDRSSNLLSKSAEEISRQFDLLDDNQLRPLIGAIQSARREVEGLNESLRDTIAATKQELAALAGDTAEVERLRYLERQTELQEQLNRAREIGDSETIASAEEALQLTEQAYRERTRQAAEQDEADKKRALEREQNEADRRIRDESEEREDISRTEQRTQTQTTQLDRAATQAVRTVDVRFPGGSFQALDDGGVDQFLDGIERGGFLASVG